MLKTKTIKNEHNPLWGAWNGLFWCPARGGSTPRRSTTFITAIRSTFVPGSPEKRLERGVLEVKDADRMKYDDLLGQVQLQQLGKALILRADLESPWRRGRGRSCPMALRVTSGYGTQARLG